jgi:hypothetical protein
MMPLRSFAVIMLVSFGTNWSDSPTPVDWSQAGSRLEKLAGSKNLTVEFG